MTTCSSGTEALAYSRAAASAFDVVLAEVNRPTCTCLLSSSTDLRGAARQFALSNPASSICRQHCIAYTPSFSADAARSPDHSISQAKLVAADEVTGRAFVDAFGDTPVVLMSEDGERGDVMRAVTLGAVDFMDKPLSVLKLKNIWQHSVRRMMQRTTLYDAGYAVAAAHQAVSEPAHGGAHVHPSISDCLPSVMTAPIGLAPSPSLAKLATLSSQPHRSSIDSPGTPSAADVDHMDSASADSSRQITSSASGGSQERRSARNASLDMDCIDEELSAPEPAAKRAHTGPAPPRAPLSCKPSSFGPLMPVPPVSHWPHLPAGCVWGTPLGGPLPPPMPAPMPAGFGAAWTTPVLSPAAAAVAPPPMPMPLAMHHDAPAPVIIRSEPVVAPAHAAPPALLLSAPDGGALPEGFLASLSASAAKNGAGPLGLKLRKSGSLLDLVNSALGAQQQAAY